MKSIIAETLSLQFPPLAIFYADEPPENACDVKVLCSIQLFVKAVLGDTVAISMGRCGCNAAARGWGLDPAWPQKFPGGKDCFLRFLSNGNENDEQGRVAIRQLEEKGLSASFMSMFREGEAYIKTPELTANFVDLLPPARTTQPYTIMKPLVDLTSDETPKTICFLVNAEQLSALVVLTNYARLGIDNVRIPFAAGCMTIGLLPFAEAEQDFPHAVIGLTDPSARLFVRKTLGKDLLTFTVPLQLFNEMESNVPESFLTRHTWKNLSEKR
jgi:hypothetical protein